MRAAVILAGGKGTRLAGVSQGVPKPLVPVAGVPIVVHQLELLARYGITDAFLTTGYRASDFPSSLGDGERFGLRLHYITETTPLGTAGGVAALAEQLTDDFLVLYGDVMVNMDLKALLDFHQERAASATIVVHPNDHPHDSDLVALEEDGRVQAFHAKPREPGGPDLDNLVSAALYVLSPSVFDVIEEGESQDFVRHVFPRLHERGEPIFGYNTTEYLKDMGTPDRLARVEQDIRSGKVARCHLDHTRPTAFLDRDGVINEEIDGVTSPEAFELIDGAGQAIRSLNQAGWLVGVATNQPAIAKGFCTQEDVEAVHRRMQRILGEAGCWVDRIAYCPHHPERGFEGEVAELKIDCRCRKPKAGLLESLASQLPAQQDQSVMIGDSWRDAAAAHSFGIDYIGVLSGHGHTHPAPESMTLEQTRPGVLVENLGAATDLLLTHDTAIENLAGTISQDPGIIAIGGLARSGKSTLCWLLKRALRARGINTLHVRLDDWILPAGERSPSTSVQERYNWDRLTTDVESLVQSGQCKAPGYDNRRRTRPNNPVSYVRDEAPVVLLDGVPALFLEVPIDLRVFVDTEEPIRQKRISRWHSLRNGAGTIDPQEDQSVRDSQNQADLVFRFSEDSPQ